MKPLLRLCTALGAMILIACTTPEMAAVASRVQEARQHNAINAHSARIRIWRDISTYDKHGWQLHSQQANRLIMPATEFEAARQLLTTQAYTAWRNHDNTPLPPKTPLPTSIAELEWLNAEGSVCGGLSITKICRESELDSKTNSVFPLVMPDEAYEQFMAIPTISKALKLILE